VGIVKNRLFYVSLVIFSGAFFYFLAGIHREVNIYDEGVVVYGAERVLRGDTPYRDFWTIYSPGQFYTLAAVLKLFGSFVLVERVWDLFVRSLLGLAIFFVGFKLTGFKPAVLCWLVATFWLGYIGYYNYPLFPAMLFSLASLLFIMNYFFKPDAVPHLRFGQV